jgi:amino acid transporter
VSIAASQPSASSSSASLRRALGGWDLTALGINQVIGGAIFLIPALIAAEIGTWSPIGFVLAGFAMLLIALCYAETASRFSVTGGAYIFARAAFGNVIGFEVGWMQWFVRVSSQAAIVTGIAGALASYWPRAADRWGNTLVVSTITLLIGYWHMKGIRQSAWAINFFTVSKLIPLFVLITGGLFLADWRSMEPLPAISSKQAITAGLLLVFAYGGFESVAVIAGEAKLPRRDVPIALGATMLSVTVVMAAAQAVYVATVPGNAKPGAPLAESAQVLLGWAGAAVIGAGSVISVIGTNVGSSLAASRMLFAFAENGDVPPSFARIHSRYRTPVVAIWFSTAVALILAITGSFVLLASVSALARLVTYTGVALATLTLRKPQCPAAAFMLPFGATIPVAATAVSLAMLAGATREQVIAGAAALAAGALLYACNTARRHAAARTVS